MIAPTTTRTEKPAPKTASRKPASQRSGSPALVAFLITAAVLIVIGIGVLITGKVQSQDPTLTAAPSSRQPGQIAQASPDKMAKEQQIQARMNAEVFAVRGPSH